MLEASAENMSMSDFKKAVKQGVVESQKIIASINSLCQTHGQKKREVTQEGTTTLLPQAISDAIHK